jgi:uncharacterized protein
VQRPSCCRPILGDPTRLRQEGQVPVFAVIYHYTDEHERREEVRPIHRTFLVGLGEAMLCAGPFAPHEDAGALLLFQASSKEAVLALLDEDPFRIHGLIAHADVRCWLPSLGHVASHLPMP